MAAQDTNLGAKLRTALAVLRGDLKPELSSPSAQLRTELVDIILSRLAAEADDPQRAVCAEAVQDSVQALPMSDTPELRAEIARVAQAEAGRMASLEQESVAGTSVSYEYPIIVATHAGGVPVPEPL